MSDHHQADHGVLNRWGRFAHRHRGWLLAGSLLAIVGALSLYAFAGHFQVGGEPSTITESGRALALMQDNLPDSTKPNFILILGDAQRTWDTPSFKTDVQAALHDLAADSRIERITTPYDLPAGQGTGLVSKDNHQVLAIVTLKVTDPSDHTKSMVAAQAAYDELRGMVHSESLHIVGTGSLALGSDFNKVFAQDMPKAGEYSLPITMLVLVVVFGAVVAALLPLGIGLVAVSGGIALTGVLANVVDLPDWSTQLVSLITLGVSIDYCLFVVNRFREELEHGTDRETALGRALATSGHAVLFSGLTVAVSLGGLAFFNGLHFAGNGYAVAAAVGFAVLLALTLLPAVLAFLGPRINVLHLGRRKAARDARRAQRESGERPGFWHNVAGGVMRHPVVATVGVLLLVGILAFPLTGLRFGGFSPEQLSSEFESRQGFDALATDFAKQGASEVTVVLDWADGVPRSDAHLGALYDLSHALAAMPHVNSVSSLADVIPGQTRDQFIATYANPSAPAPPGLVGGSIAVLTVHVDVVADAPEAGTLVKDIRALQHAAGSSVLVGGFTAQRVDTVDLIAARLPYAATFIVLATILILMVQVRSVILPVKAVLMNLLSVGASFGLATWIFQDGHLTGLLHFTPTPLEPGNMVLMFCIVFGLSMDYEVLLLSRMHEAYRRTGDNRKAVQQGLEASGRIITGAALIMVFVFGTFGIVRITFMKVIGVGLAFAVLFDATVIRAILVPALMRMMGKWNWWSPKWMALRAPPASAAAVLVAPPTVVPDHGGPTAVALRTPSLVDARVEALAQRDARRAVVAEQPRYEPTVIASFTDPAVQAWFDREQAKRVPPKPLR